MANQRDAGLVKNKYLSSGGSIIEVEDSGLSNDRAALKTYLLIKNLPRAGKYFQFLAFIKTLKGKYFVRWYEAEVGLEKK